MSFVSCCDDDHQFTHFVGISHACYFLLFIFTSRNTIWYHLALKAKDQLRQRMAWALYQIVPISAPSGFVAYTEEWLVYYDVFVRHAFGSYRNVLKEVSYQDLMAEWLSFISNRSIQSQVDEGSELHFPDENYACEIMQLFSIGVVQLNMDGTPKLDEDGHSPLSFSELRWHASSNKQHSDSPKQKPLIMAIVSEQLQMFAG